MTRVLSVAVVVLTASCGTAPVQHIREHEARSRTFDPGDYEQTTTALSNGSLWRADSRSLFADFRAAQVGDVVTVRIDENPRAVGDANTNMDRQSDLSFGIPGLFGLTSALTRAYPDLDSEKLIDIISQSGFDGAGSTRRSSRIEAAVAVRVRRTLPNGDLFIEGSKILLVNDEELHMYLSGVIRPADIAQDNTVSSGQIADAEIELTGRGDLATNQRQGWLRRLVTEVSPL